MYITTDFPCGNGRVRWLSPNVFGVEVIAYSKNPRYTTFRVVDVGEDAPLTVVLTPDQWDRFTFTKLRGIVVWMRTLPDGEWIPVPENQVRFQPEAITVEFSLKAGQSLEVSTEPPRRYSETTALLAGICDENPGTCALHIIGNSYEDRPVVLLRVSEDVHQTGRKGEEQKPVILCISGSHAAEFAGEEINRGMLAAVLEDTPEGKRLRSSYIFDFILNANPDGNYHGWHQYNKKDWLSHNYQVKEDRSWHHEFVVAFNDPDSEQVSPEARALVDWINLTGPVFIHDAHSWEGHEGRIGAFRADLDRLDPLLADCLNFIDHTCVTAAAELGMEFLIFPMSNLCAGHLSEVITDQRGIPMYTIEGHPSVPRDKLQEFGRNVLQLWLRKAGVLSDQIRKKEQEDIRIPASSERSGV